MSIIFNPNEPLPENGFNGVFLTQTSYMNLLELVKISLNGYEFNGFNFSIQPLPYSYMFITRKPDRLKFGLGKSVSLKITHIAYSVSSLTIIALVMMKNNFTDRDIPHIVITGKSTLNSTSTSPINLADFKVVPLHAPYTVHGKLGVMAPVKSNDIGTESPKPATVSKPELTLSVENSPPPGEGGKEEEYYLGQKIIKGRQGGKYVFSKDGQRRYITDAMIANAKNKNNVVYNINFLSEDNGGKSN